jgi:outer membrane protein assembly factor BamD
MKSSSLLRNCASFFIVALFPLFFLTQCSSKEVNKDDPEAVYQEAEAAFKDEHYLIAVERFRDVKNRFPYSSRAVDAELRLADTYFEQENYLEAESAYEIFRELHPTHSRSDYVQYRIGLSYYNQIPSNTARDLSAAYRAIDAFSVLVDKFPSSEYAPKAKEQMEEARKKLAEHENYVADFYYERKHYLSASYRYAALLQGYPKLGYDEQALYRLGKCYYHVKMFSNAVDSFKSLLGQFPNTSHKAEVESLLAELKKN